MVLGLQTNKVRWNLVLRREHYRYFKKGKWLGTVYVSDSQGGILGAGLGVPPNCLTESPRQGFNVLEEH